MCSAFRFAGQHRGNTLTAPLEGVMAEQNLSEECRLADSIRHLRLPERTGSWVASKVHRRSGSERSGIQFDSKGLATLPPPRFARVEAYPDNQETLWPGRQLDFETMP